MIDLQAGTSPHCAPVSGTSSWAVKGEKLVFWRVPETSGVSRACQEIMCGLWMQTVQGRTPSPINVCLAGSPTDPVAARLQWGLWAEQPGRGHGGNEGMAIVFQSPLVLPMNPWRWIDPGPGQFPGAVSTLSRTQWPRFTIPYVLYIGVLMLNPSL